MDSVIDTQRSLHEEIERLEQAIVKTLLDKPKSHKDKVTNEHRIARFLSRMQKRANSLWSLYDNEDGMRDKELDVITNSELGEFYHRLKMIKDAHRLTPNEAARPVNEDFAIIDHEKEVEALDGLFSGEEAFGKCLDVHELHADFCNLKCTGHVDYFSYLKIMDQFGNISPDDKKDPVYKAYVAKFLAYLEDFFGRSQPLLNFDAVKEEIREEFNAKWAVGELPGWSSLLHSGHQESIDMSLFCVACNKEFAKKTVFDAHFTGKKHKEAAAKMQQDPDAVQVAKRRRLLEIEEENKRVASCEFHIQKFLELLQAEREGTKESVERKQTLTVEELNADNEEAPEEIGEESDDEKDNNSKLYNPLKLPMGWDGKPIPFWLYKLHGLGIQYPCEICGNYVYMGRKPFERHFSEWRHVYGLRCLGIPSSKQFHEITKIKDALALWEFLQVKQKEIKTKEESVEEFEDAHGNVYSKKTYEDLKRQGLL